MSNEVFTIEIKHYNLIVHTRKIKGSRLEWSAPGIEFYIKGSFKGGAYEQAANLALNMCIDRHIPAIALRRQRPYHRGA